MDDKKKKEFESPELEIIEFVGELDTLVDSGEGGWESGNMEGWWH